MLPVVLALLLHAEAPAPAAEPAPAPAAPAQPDERLDHRGAVGLIIGLSGLRKESNAPIENTWRGALTAGASFNVGWRSNEIIILATVSMARTEILDLSTMTKQYGLGVDGQLWGTFRGYFGDRWKTFVDIGLAALVVPGFTIGPRVGVGMQYELSSLSGLFAAIAAQLGYGSALVFRAELMLGVQLRSFLLE